MLPTIKLFDHLLAQGRLCRETGRFEEASRLLQQLAQFPHLPRKTAEDNQAELGELSIERKHFRQARRSLSAALAYNPTNARYHYMMAVAWSKGSRANLDRAADHFTRSLLEDPNQVACLGAYGLLLFKMEMPVEGLGYLRKAVELAPDDARAVRRLAKGLRRCGKWREMEKLLKEALFRNPRSAEFIQLWRAYRYRRAMRLQARDRRQEQPAKEITPTVLPFVRMADEPGKVADVEVRNDGPEILSPPHFPRLARRQVQ